MKQQSKPKVKHKSSFPLKNGRKNIEEYLYDLNTLSEAYCRKVLELTRTDYPSHTDNLSDLYLGGSNQKTRLWHLIHHHSNL